MRARSAFVTGLGLGVLIFVALVWLVPAATVGRPDAGCFLHPATFDTSLPPGFRLEQTPQGDYNPWLQHLTCTWLSDAGEPFTRTYWVGVWFYITVAAIGGPIGVVLLVGAVRDVVRCSRRRVDP